MSEIDLSMNINDILCDIDNGVVRPMMVGATLQVIKRGIDAAPWLEDAINSFAAVSGNGAKRRPYRRHDRSAAGCTTTLTQEYQREMEATAAAKDLEARDADGAIQITNEAPRSRGWPKGKKRGRRTKPEEKSAEIGDPTDSQIEQLNARGAEE